MVLTLNPVYLAHAFIIVVSAENFPRYFLSVFMYSRQMYSKSLTCSLLGCRQLKKFCLDNYL